MDIRFDCQFCFFSAYNTLFLGYKIRGVGFRKSDKEEIGVNLLLPASNN
jgi:hypothetical protein